jgi:hypothetical protein
VATSTGYIHMPPGHFFLSVRVRGQFPEASLQGHRAHRPGYGRSGAAFTHPVSSLSPTREPAGSGAGSRLTSDVESWAFASVTLTFFATCTSGPAEQVILTTLSSEMVMRESRVGRNVTKVEGRMIGYLFELCTWRSTGRVGIVEVSGPESYLRRETSTELSMDA